MTGSSDVFNHDGRTQRAGVNHVTVHDGFTLADLFSYNEKHNEANGEDNRDGSSDNHSNNCGHEGPTDDAAIIALRRQLRKNQLACLLLAQGLPLILAGDEVGNTQNGNNNAYCQDNEIGWVGWEGLNREGDDLTDFVGHMTELAKALSADPLAPLARRTARRRLLWRAVADAGGRGDERPGLEIPGRAVSRLCAGPGRARTGADLHRAECRARRDRVQTAEDAGIQELAAGAEHRRRQADGRGLRIGSRHQGASPLGSGLCGLGMNERQFGAKLTSDGASFRLWAPAAKRVDLLLDKPHPLRRGEDGWFSADIPGVKAGARYKFRIDDEIDVPDPASAFQPDDVSGPSEVIDHAAYPMARYATGADVRGRKPS